MNNNYVNEFKLWSRPFFAFCSSPVAKIRFILNAAAFALIVLAAVSCDLRLNSPKPIIKIPAFLVRYDGLPFDSLNSHVFKLVMDPLWDELRDDHSELELFNFGVSADLAPSQASEAFEKCLCEKWKPDAHLSRQSVWGWSLGYRNGKYVFVFVATNSEKVDAQDSFPIIRAGIITDSKISNK